MKGEQGYILYRKGQGISPFLDMKLLLNGNLIMHEKETLDLVLYDHEMKELKRLKENVFENLEVPLPKLGRIKQGSSNSHYAWYSGSSSINLVNLTDFNHVIVKNFFGQENPQLKVLAVVAASTPYKMAALYTEDQDDQVFIAVMTSESSISRQKLNGIYIIQGSSVLPELSAHCIEASLDDTLLFLGGATSSDSGNSTPAISAFSFECFPREICTFEISSLGKNPVEFLKRFEEPNYLLGANSNFICVLEWTGIHFNVLTTVENLHTGNL